MDKVKAQLALVKQHSFWVMCVGILIVCLVSWYMSTKAINKEREAQLAAIKGVFDGLNSISTSNPQHPNLQTGEGMDALNRAYSEEVAAAWQKQYDRQADVLVWPPSFREDEKFITAVDKLRPIEVVPFPTPITSDIDIDSRRLYRDYIAVEIPRLAEIIGARWVAVATATGGGEGYGGSSAMSGYGGALGGAGSSYPGASASYPGASGYTGASGGYPGASGSYPGASGSYPGGAYSGGVGPDGMPLGPVEDKSIVTWAPDNQQQLYNTHFGFVVRPDPPTTLEVLYAQEDLWVLENLMQLIRAANDNASARHEAAIKHIDFVRLGRSAIGMAGNITPVGRGGVGMDGSMMSGMPGSSGMMPGMSAGAGGSGGADMASTDTASAGGSAGMMMGGMGGAAAAPIDPAYGRYVDDKYAVLDPAKLRLAHSSQNKEDALLAVAKRMPIRMRFRIDQRKMSKLLAECGNAKLPVEVRQVRLNRAPAPVGGMGGGGYGDMASGYGGSGGGGYGYGGSSMGGYGGDMSAGYGGMPGSSDMADAGYSSGGYPGGYGGSSASAGYGGMSGYPGASGGLPGTAPRAVGGVNSTATIDYNLVDVELYGMVYIYNPPNRAQLSGEATTTAATSPAAAPVVPTPVGEPAPATPATTTPPTTPTSAPATPAATSTPPAAIVPAVGGGS
jgi:hypothetical protein